MTGVRSTAPGSPAAAGLAQPESERVPVAGGWVERPASSAPTLVIQPRRGLASVNVRELWANRGLLGFLVWRDIKVRYAQTALGAAWAVLQPVLTTVVFTLIFGRLAKLPSDGAPYAAFALAAMVPWTFFSTALTSASNSLVSNTNLITKTYFPRLVIPLASALAALMDLAVAFVLLIGVCLWYGLVPSAGAVLLIPLLVLSMLMTVTGVGCWLAALNVQYRDVRYVVPFLLQVWMYASPVVYPSSMVPPAYRTLYALNPLVGVIEGFRSALLHTTPTPWRTIGVSCLAGCVLFVGGVLYFRHVEPRFADVA